VLPVGNCPYLVCQNVAEVHVNNIFLTKLTHIFGQSEPSDFDVGGRPMDLSLEKPYVFESFQCSPVSPYNYLSTSRQFRKYSIQPRHFEMQF
jgi:hypothetical protein